MPLTAATPSQHWCYFLLASWLAHLFSRYATDVSINQYLDPRPGDSSGDTSATGACIVLPRSCRRGRSAAPIADPSIPQYQHQHLKKGDG